MDPRQQSYHDRPSSSYTGVPDDRERRDSAATLYGRGGYNQASYSSAGRAEPLKGDPEADGAPDDGWDVYADFNNAGPKYASVSYSGGSGHEYQPVGSPGAKADDDATLAGPGSRGVELVTVPALGAEWKSSELRDMTSAGQRARAAERRGDRWAAFTSGKRGMCGIPWLTRKVLTFVLFFLVIAAGVTLAFTLPRVPGFALNVDTPLMNATGAFAAAVPTLFVRAPAANFSFPAIADVQVDTGASFLPLRMRELEATVTDSQTGLRVATGNVSSVLVPAKVLFNLQIPLNFSYTAINASDQTWVNWRSACANPSSITGGQRPGISFTLALSYRIFGLPGTKHTSTNVLSANCPIVLPTSAG